MFYLAPSDDSKQDTNIEEALERLQENDPSLTDLNLNNHPKMNAHYHQRLVTVLRDNVSLRKLSLANTRADDNVASVSVFHLLCSGFLKFCVCVCVCVCAMYSV